MTVNGRPSDAALDAAGRTLAVMRQQAAEWDAAHTSGPSPAGEKADRATTSAAGRRALTPSRATRPAAGNQTSVAASRQSPPAALAATEHTRSA